MQLFMVFQRKKKFPPHFKNLRTCRCTLCVCWYEHLKVVWARFKFLWTRACSQSWSQADCIESWVQPELEVRFFTLICCCSSRVASTSRLQRTRLLYKRSKATARYNKAVPAALATWRRISIKKNSRVCSWILN